MANIKSALKRVQITERNRLSNKSYKSAIKTYTKHFLAAIDTYTAQPTTENLEAAQAALTTAYSKVDKAVKRGVLHINTGSRKKARLNNVLRRVTSA